jgi:hypothetical protein
MTIILYIYLYATKISKKSSFLYRNDPKIQNIIKVKKLNHILKFTIYDIEATLKQGQVKEAITFLPLIYDILKHGESLKTQNQGKIKSLLFYKDQYILSKRLKKMHNIKYHLKSAKFFTKYDENIPKA